MKNLYVLVHPDLSLEDLQVKHQELVSDGHDMIILDHGDKHGVVFNWCHTNPPNVLEHHHVRAGELDQSFGQVVQEYANRYDEIFPYSVEDDGAVAVSSFEYVEELIEKHDDNEDGQLSAEELEDVVEDLVEYVEENVEEEEEEDVVEDLVEDALDEKNTTDDSVSDSDDSDGGSNSWMRHN